MSLSLDDINWELVDQLDKVKNTLLPHIFKPFENHPDISHINIETDGYTVFHKNQNVYFISNHELSIVKTRYLNEWLYHQHLAQLNQSIKDWEKKTKKEIEDYDRYEAAQHQAKTLFQS